MSVVHFSYASDGGAGRAGRRAHLACRAADIESTFAFVEGRSAEPSDIHLPKAVRPDRQCADALADTLEMSVQWDFLAKARTPVSNTLLSIPYPGISAADHVMFRTADIIHLHWPTWAATPQTIGRWLSEGRTVFWTLHDFWPMTGGCHYPSGCTQFQTHCMKCPQLRGDVSLISNAFTDKLRSYGGGGSLHIVSPSAYLAEQARLSKILGDRPIAVVPNPIELDVYAPRKERHDLRAAFGVRRKDVVIFFGSFDLAEKRKGVDLLWQAVKLVMGDGRLAATLEEDAKVYVAVMGKSVRLEEIPGVEYLNFGTIDHDDVMADVLSVSDVACFPSLEDNYPNGIVESMACGTPCLGFATGGIREMIDDGQTGVLVDQIGSVTALAEGLLRICKNMVGGAHVRLACRAVVEKINSPEIVGQRLKKLYRAALKRPVEANSYKLRSRVARAFANTPVARDAQPTRDFLQFPVNLVVRKMATDKALLEQYNVPKTHRSLGRHRLLSVRTQHEHHSGFSGPYQFLRHLPSGEYDVSHYSIPLGNDFAGDKSELYSRAGLLMNAVGLSQQGNYWLGEAEVLMNCVAEEVGVVHYIDGEHGGWLLPRLPTTVFKNGKRPKFATTLHQPPDVLKTIVNLDLLKHLDAVVALCQSQKDYLAKYVSEDRLFLIPHGVDTEFFHPREFESAGRADGKLKLLLVGHWLRDLDAVFEVFEVVRGQGIDAELTVVSPYFPTSRVSRGFELRSKLSDEELREAYWASDILLIPLIDATANNAILEAMACGKPVVSTSVGGVPDAVGDAGLLCAPGDIPAMVRAVMSLSMPAARNKIGRAARKQAEQFSWDRIGRAHHAMYSQILGVAKPAAAARGARKSAANK